MKFDERKLMLKKSFGLKFSGVEKKRFWMKKKFIPKQIFYPKIINVPNRILGLKNRKIAPKL